MWYILLIKEWYFFMRFTHAINVVIPFGNSNNIINETNKIDGCTSQAWVVVKKNSDDTFSISTDSDSQIVKGLLSVLEKIFQNLHIFFMLPIVQYVHCVQLTPSSFHIIPESRTTTGMEASMMISLGACRLVMPLSESTMASQGRSSVP